MQRELPASACAARRPAQAPAAPAPPLPPSACRERSPMPASPRLHTTRWRRGWPVPATRCACFGPGRDGCSHARTLTGMWAAPAGRARGVGRLCPCCHCRLVAAGCAHGRCAAPLAPTPLQVVVVEQTETPDMLKTRNEERTRQGLKKVRTRVWWWWWCVCVKGGGGGRGLVKPHPPFLHLQLCRETGRAAAAPAVVPPSTVAAQGQGPGRPAGDWVPTCLPLPSPARPPPCRRRWCGGRGWRC
jgi:hypothetical protein